MNYRKKPVVIQAVKFDGVNRGGELSPKLATFLLGVRYIVAGDELVIPTTEGDMKASGGDWIIKGVKGEFYPCKPDIFAATYEPA